VSGLRLELAVPCDRFQVEIGWETSTPDLGLFGPSGAGKTTVIEALAGLRDDARGRIEVNGRTWLDTARGIRLAPEERDVGYVPQDGLLFPHLDVLGNLRVGEGRARRASRRWTPAVVLDLLELGDLAARPVGALSGGERQRVALGRALCSAPALLLLDEPLAALDRPLRRRILPYLLRVREELGIPTLYVSHDASEMTLLASEVSVLEAGRLTARGRPEEVFGGGARSAADAAERIVNILRGSVGAVADSLATVEIEPGLEVFVADGGAYVRGQRVAVELRAADVLLAVGLSGRHSAQNVLAATVVQVHLPSPARPQAPAVVTTAVGGGAFPVSAVVSRRACRELGLAPGVELHLLFKAQACRLLAAR
jgi:molybdate transport system ATP-binding protein